MGKHNKTKEKTRTKKKKKVGFKVFIIILLILVVLGGIFAKRVYDLGEGWNLQGLIAVLLGHDKKTLDNLERLDILVMGESTGMSDTIIVCSYDPKTQQASMLSIPRDTFVGKSKTSARTDDKINALYSAGKVPEKTMEAVNKITGLNIKNYILVDTEAVVKLVDLIKGVEFDVPIDMNYDDESQDLHINLKAGMQTLNGNQVEQVVRFRHNNNGSTYPNSYGYEDFGRMRTQRTLITAVVKKTFNVKNIKEIKNIIDIAKKYVKTNMNLDELKDYIPYATSLNTDEIKTEQLPGEAKYLNGISFFLYDEDETKKVINDLLFSGPKDENSENNEVN